MKIRLTLSAILLFMACVPSAMVCFAAFQENSWGARPTGMGGAFSAIADDANAPLWNPAGITQIMQKEATAMYGQPFMGLDGADVLLNYVSLVWPQSKIGGFGMSWARFSQQDIYGENTITLTYAKNISRYSMGVNLKYLNYGFALNEQTGDDPAFADSTSKSVFTFDLGALVDVTKKISLGLYSKNLTQPDLGFRQKEVLPIESRIGVGYRDKFHEVAEVATALDVVLPGDEGKVVSIRDRYISLGVECWLVKALALRVGYSSRTDAGTLRADVGTGLSMGAGCRIRMIQLDYGFSNNGALENTQQISLTVRF